MVCQNILLQPFKYDVDVFTVRVYFSSLQFPLRIFTGKSIHTAYGCVCANGKWETVNTYYRSAVMRMRVLYQILLNSWMFTFLNVEIFIFRYNGFLQIYEFCFKLKIFHSLFLFFFYFSPNYRKTFLLFSKLFSKNTSCKRKPQKVHHIVVIVIA